MDKNRTSEVINKIFRKPNIQFGLAEFEGIKIPQVITIFEKEKSRFYLKCFKRNIDLIVWRRQKEKLRK